MNYSSLILFCGCASAIICYAGSPKSTSINEPSPLLTLRERQPGWISEVISYYPEGTPHIVEYFETVDQIALPVKELELSPEGFLIRESDVIEREHSLLRHGPTILYSNAGTLEVLAYYINGQLEGPYKTFYPNGKLKNLYALRQGEKEGPYKLWNENEVLQEIGTYHANQLNGWIERYHSNGQISYRACYQNGILIGEVQEWGEQGNIVQKATYRQGLLHSDKSNAAFQKFFPNQHLKEIQEFQWGALLMGL